MPRSKVRLAWIQNDSARRATLKKRWQSSMKKVNELGILCGIPICYILSGPYETVSETWSSEKLAATIVTRYLEMPENEQRKKRLNQEEFICLQIEKFNQLVRKLEYENRNKEMTALMYDCIRGKGVDTLTSVDEIKNLMFVLDRNLLNLRDKILKMKRADSLGRLAGRRRLIDVGAAAPSYASFAAGMPAVPNLESMDYSMDSPMSQNSNVNMQIDPPQFHPDINN